MSEDAARTQLCQDPMDLKAPLAIWPHKTSSPTFCKFTADELTSILKTLYFRKIKGNNLSAVSLLCLPFPITATHVKSPNPYPLLLWSTAHTSSFLLSKRSLQVVALAETSKGGVEGSAKRPVHTTPVKLRLPTFLIAAQPHTHRAGTAFIIKLISAWLSHS